MNENQNGVITNDAPEKTTLPKKSKITIKVLLGSLIITLLAVAILVPQINTQTDRAMKLINLQLLMQ